MEDEEREREREDQTGEEPEKIEIEDQTEEKKERRSTKGQKRDYKTRHQVQLVLTEMEHQICEGKSDIEIMKFLEIKDRSFYYFKKKLYQQSLALQTSKKTEEVLTFETRILKERLTKVYQHLDERLTMINRDPRVNDNMAEVALATFQIAKSIMNLELEGLKALSGIRENKFLKYANKYYEDAVNYPSPNISRS
jgi:hypothetical protein